MTRRRQRGDLDHPAPFVVRPRPRAFHAGPGRSRLLPPVGNAGALAELEAAAAKLRGADLALIVLGLVQGGRREGAAPEVVIRELEGLVGFMFPAVRTWLMEAITER